MGQIEQHSKIAVGLRHSHDPEPKVREGHAKRTASVQETPMEQLDIFG
jgi:hypothetical protein